MLGRRSTTPDGTLSRVVQHSPEWGVRRKEVSGSLRQATAEVMRSPRQSM